MTKVSRGASTRTRPIDSQLSAQSVTKQSHHHTKINALFALREIGSIVAVGGDCIGAEVRKQVGYDDFLVKTMRIIADFMTIDEKRDLDSVGISALEAFDKERKAYCVFGDFPEVLETSQKGSCRTSECYTQPG